ncbi:hypothetical protein OJF2_51190 [Aquisphaera giovannonii]|uniref:Uncharacterized protein n=1 Tax=Aquisphaera giovannonii TaxID=406548 RepID=A0A5B9W8W2_9BACT|nr:hypothetical protein [Aquisphaera giovannonii]QEH36535.1 hypothetical protein OJF2_51190 [Aquisphaera giovannonii]
MTLRDDAILLSGFIYGASPSIPEPIRQAIERVTSHFEEKAGSAAGQPEPEPLQEKPSSEVLDDFGGFSQTTEVHRASSTDSAAPAQPDPESTSVKKPRKTRNWSPEKRAAQADRIRAINQRKREANRQPLVENRDEPAVAEEPDPVPEFDEADLRITIPKPRRKSQLTDDDWPEIERMLEQGRTRRAIASDYDEDPADLDAFIASHQQKERPKGEAPASPSGGTSDATRRPT